ncbi:MAG: hypothetical protein MUC92_11385 [Fimbriimonadaceae bacterium]|jgi:transcriptional regulator of arginine metabolism|nr:hypothetical protein [Fimbriimonadaceae bacterium]
MATEERNRQKRLAAIVSILRDREVTNQNELVDLLKMRGFLATQSSISRDLNDLTVAKVSGRYVVPGQPTGITVSQLVAEGLLSFSPAGPNLLVVKTRAACAGRVGMVIDGLDLPEVVGTVAGNDTLFVATMDRSDQQVIMDLLDRALRA